MLLLNYKTIKEIEENVKEAINYYNSLDYPYKECNIKIILEEFRINKNEFKGNEVISNIDIMYKFHSCRVDFFNISDYYNTIFGKKTYAYNPKMYGIGLVKKEKLYKEELEDILDEIIDLIQNEILKEI